MPQFSLLNNRQTQRMTMGAMAIKSFTDTLSKKWGEKKSQASNALKKYRSRKYYRHKRIRYAQTISYRELEERLSNFVVSPFPKNLIRLLHHITNSGIWIGHSYYQYVKTSLDFSPALHELEFTKEENLLLKRAQKQKKLGKNTQPDVLFSALFKETEYAHLHEHYRPKIHASHSPVTVVLISGVFNEIFSTPAFERAAIYLKEKYGIKYICPEVRGTKGSKANAKLLERQLRDYINLNPQEKLWIVAFSKGGVDTLHFLKDNKEFAEKSIIGLSTIASPILGTDHTENQLLKALTLLHKISETPLAKNRDILLKEIYQSMSSKYQKQWFQKNASKLPNLKFYSSLALKSSWYESHIWMLMTKAFFQSASPNDGIVDVEHALFPESFGGINFGVIEGHHLIGSRSSSFPQEALLESYLIALQKLGYLPIKKQ